MLSQLAESRKHPQPLMESEASPSKRLKMDKEMVEPKGRLLKPNPSSADKIRVADASKSNSSNSNVAPPAHQQPTEDGSELLNSDSVKDGEGKDTASTVPSVDEDDQDLEGTDENPILIEGSAADGKVFRCNKCEHVCNSQQNLIVHKLLMHLTNQEAEQLVDQTLAASKADPEVVDKVIAMEPATGFQDLVCMDFTTRKFSLAAKSVCEKIPRQSNSRFHNFACRKCFLSFPSKSSLLLHQASHRSRKQTKCPQCECHFISSEQLRTHMHIHKADESFSKSQTDLPDTMGKKNFLAMFGLIGTEDLGDSSETSQNEEAIEAISKEQNNQYFPKINKAFAAHKANPDSIITTARSSVNGDEDSPAPDSPTASIPSIPSSEKPTVVPSTDIAVFPPTSTPPELPSPVTAQPAVVTPNLFPSFIAKPLVIPKTGFLGSDLHLPVVAGLQPGRFVPVSAASPHHGSPVSVDGAREQGKEVFSCAYCGASFLNKRALRGELFLLSFFRHFT